jgi:DNA-binding NtrC family response regulator
MSIAQAPDMDDSFKKKVAEYERSLILAALRDAGGNQRRAARALGVLPTTLNEKMKRLGLRPAREPLAFDGSSPAAS